MARFGRWRFCGSPDFSRSVRLGPLVVLVLGLTASLAGAAPGDLDATFAGDGTVTVDFSGGFDHGVDVAVQPDGTIVAAGQANQCDTGLIRLNADGTLDGSFGIAGRFATDFAGHPCGATDGAHSVALQSDGRIVTVGLAGGDGMVALTRHNANGTLDPTFGSGGQVVTDPGDGYSQGEAVALQPDGKIVAGGFGHGFVNDIVVLRYDSSGALDPTFGSGGIVFVDLGSTESVHNEGLLIQPDGKIVAVGGSGSTFAVLRFDANGTLDSTFGSGGIVQAVPGSGTAGALQPDGKIVQAGIIGGDFAVARYLSTGALDGSFGSGGVATADLGGFDVANGLALQANGSVVVLGYTGGDVAVARFTADGSLDTSFSGDGFTTADVAAGSNDFGQSVAIQPDGKIVGVGLICGGGTVGGCDFGLARFDGGPAGAPPVGPPTDKDQCKDEGWRTFNTPRTFENQGDCIQFVNTGK